MKRRIIIISALCFSLVIVAWFTFHRLGAFPCWIVWGTIVDNNNAPIENAIVKVRLGDATESTPFDTGQNGKFFSYVILPAWSFCKGAPPSISVYRTGYREYWRYYKQWSWGVRISHIEIKLQRGLVSPPVREDY